MKRCTLILTLTASCLAGCQLTSTHTETWTILCHEFTGAQHQDNCEVVAEALGRTPDMRSDAVRCDHDPSAATSRLYYGEYACTRVNSPWKQNLEMSPQMQRDYRLILDLADDHRRQVFPVARMVPLVRPIAARRDGPKYSLTDSSGSCSLQIAVFYPEPGFDDPRAAAEELVRELRGDGHEAYYYHGSASSSVTVGSFDANVTRESPEVQALIRSDPRFRYNYENYEVRKRILQGVETGGGSFLVKVPGRSGEDAVGP